MNAVDENIEQTVYDYLQENPPTVDLEGYATEEYVDNAVAAIPTADLSNYYTKPEANAKFATKEEIPSTSGLATEQFVNSKVSGLATENYVNSANSNVLQTVSQNYALKSEVPSTDNFATKLYVDTSANAVRNEITTSENTTKKYIDQQIAAIPQPDLSDYALKSEIPSTAGLATEEYVDQKVSEIEASGGVDLSGYATEEYVDQKVAAIEIPEMPDLSGYALKSEIPSTAGLATESYVDNAVSNVKVDLTGYATESYVDGAIAAIPQPDLSGYALKSEIPDTSGFITEIPAEYVTETELEGKGYLTEHQSLEGYATEEYVDTAIANIPSSGGGSGGNVAVDGTTIIQNEDGTISTAVGGSREKIADGTLLYTTPASNFNGNYWSMDGRNAMDSAVNGLSRWIVKYIITKEDGTILQGEVETNISANSSGRVMFEDGIIKWASYYSMDFSYRVVPVDNSQFSTNDTLYIELWTLPEYNYSTIKFNYIPYNTNDFSIDSDSNIKISNDLIKNSFTIGKENTYNDSSYNVNICIGQHNEARNTAIVSGVSNRAENCCILGYECQAFGYRHVLTGTGLLATSNSRNWQGIAGTYNIEDSNGEYSYIIGIGDSSNRANGFTLDGSGNGAFAGQVSSTGSDYAEYFEWADGNPEAEDRIGYLVALDGDKIRLAKPGDEILGIVSGTVAVLGDNHEWQWQGKYLTDDYGRVIYDMVDKYEEYEGEQVYLGTFPEPRINPEWDETATYIPRAKRKEWDAVGLLGKLYVRDDGTCKPNDYIKVGADGIATVSAEKTNMRVMSRKTDNIVKVYVR